MSAADVLKVLRLPGRLVLAPLSCVTGQVFPYGGQELGRTRYAKLHWGTVFDSVVDENWGEITEESRASKAPFFSFALEQWDDTVLALAYDRVTTSGRDQFRLDGGAPPGQVAASAPILFAPLNENDKAVYFRRPLLHEQEGGETDFVLDKLALHPLLMRPTRDSSYATTPYWQVGMLGDLVL